MTTVRVGDVFVMPVSPGRVACGQVVHKRHRNGPFFAVFFEPLFQDSVGELSSVPSLPILLAGNTLDARIERGLWKILGNEGPDFSRIALPKFKVTIGCDVRRYVESLDGAQRREARPGEWELLTFRTTVAPVRFERAVRACHGFEPWAPEFDELKYEWVKARAYPLV